MTLLRDALERTLLDPHCAPRWHRLTAIWEATPDAAARAGVIERLTRGPLDGARAEIQRLTFLAAATGDADWERQAATQVLAARPEDADRLAAYLAYHWLHALQEREGRADFLAAMAAGEAPALARRLAALAAAERPPGLAPRATADPRRVAVVLPYVGHRFHTPSLMAIEQCRVLAETGREVAVLSAQELLPPDPAQFRGDGREPKLPALDARGWAVLLPAGVTMTIADPRYGMVGRWRILLEKIARFDPDAVLLVGLYSPLAAALFPLRPSLGLSVNTVAPLAPVDVWLAGDGQAAAGSPWGDAFAAPEAVAHSFRLRRRALPAASRAELGVPVNAVLWITAGFRLEHEVRGDWARRVGELLARRPEVVWLLVGGEGWLPPAVQGVAPGRVRALRTRDDVPALLRSADIYVNPPRMGGGFSVAEAMAEGLPVVTLAGSDGGDKVGELALPDIDAYFGRLDELCRDRAQRVAMGEALQRRFAERYDLAASGPALVAALRRAAELAATRLTASS